MKEQIIQMIDDKQYKLDKLIIAEMHGTEINELDKTTLEIEIKTLTSVLKLFSIHGVVVNEAFKEDNLLDDHITDPPMTDYSWKESKSEVALPLNDGNIESADFVIGDYDDDSDLK